MDQYKTPGVYVEETSTLAPSVAGVATAIPAFVGYTQIEQDAPVKITSLLEYKEIFGETPALSFKDGVLTGKDSVMYNSIRMYYDNGGTVCYIVSVKRKKIEKTEKGEKTVDIPAVDGYSDAIAKVADIDEVTLLACPDAAIILNAEDLKSVHEKMVAHCATLKDRFAILDVKTDLAATGTTTNIIEKDIANFRTISAEGLKYAAAYYPFIKSAYKADIPYATVIAYMQSDARYKKDANLTEAAKETDTIKQKAFAAKLANYAKALAELQDEASVITPSGAVVGAIVRTDNNSGVWKAPANVAISSVKSVTRPINDTIQSGLNIDETGGLSVNAIRVFTGKGTLIWGARTLDGNDNEWRYIPVRRLFNYIEESVQKSTAWAVFQPNDANTWVKIKCQISNFLTGLWREGALAGATPDEAYFVNVGLGITMTEDDIYNGNLKVEVGLAAVRPAEFIVLTFSHKVQE